MQPRSTLHAASYHIPTVFAVYVAIAQLEYLIYYFNIFVNIFTFFYVVGLSLILVICLFEIAAHHIQIQCIALQLESMLCATRMPCAYIVYSCNWLWNIISIYWLQCVRILCIWCLLSDIEKRRNYNLITTNQQFRQHLMMLNNALALRAYNQNADTL